MVNTTVIRADKRLRKQVVTAFVLCIPIGLFLIHGFSSYIKECMMIPDTESAIIKIRKLLSIVTVVNAAISVILSLYLVSVAVRIFKSERFPPPGLRVVRDTRLQTGKRAKIAGAILIFLAAVILSVNLIMWYLYKIIDNMLI